MGRPHVSAKANPLARALIDCLGRQATQFKTFMDLLGQQRSALVERDTERLERVIALQEQAISHSKQIERERQALTTQLASLNSATDSDPSLTGIAELVEASQGSEMLAMQDQLRSLQNEIDRRRTLNSNLIEESMRCTSDALQWIAGRMRPQPVYGAKHQRSSEGSGQIAVNRRC